MVLFRNWKVGMFSTAEIVDILKAFKIYSMRRRLLGLAMGENKALPTLTKYIPELQKAKDKKLKMFEILAGQESNLRLPNDIELSRYLTTMNFYNYKYCKFFLTIIEEKITKSRPDINDSNLQIEHIMPQKLNDKWEEELGENAEDIHQEYVHNIGNLTLIRHNQELGQKPFAEKKEIYENKAGLQLAKKEILNQEHWNEDSIKKRADWIVDYLLKDVLEIPDNMRKVNNFKEKEGRGLSFQNLQLIGLDIQFCDDPSITARVVSDKEVEFEGEKWKLSPLTKEIQKRRGLLNASGHYKGSQWWEYDGIRLIDIM
jgi:hypothetical protein